MTLPNVEVTTDFEKSLCYDCPDLIEGVNRFNPYGRKSKHENDSHVSTIKCKRTNGFPVPRMKCEWRQE